MMPSVSKTADAARLDGTKTRRGAAAAAAPSIVVHATTPVLRPPRRRRRGGWRNATAGLVALAATLSLLLRLVWHPYNLQYWAPPTNSNLLLSLPTSKNGVAGNSQLPNPLLLAAPPSRAGSSSQARFNFSLEDWSSVDYMACCGLGHRLTKMSDAYLVSQRLHLGLRAFWGYCADDDDPTSPSSIEVFHYLFGPQPMAELERLAVSSGATVGPMRWGNYTLDHSLRVANNVKYFLPVRRHGGTNDTTCLCTVEKIESDRIFYLGLRQRFRFREAVDEFRNRHFGSDRRSGQPVLGVHIRTGNGETGDFTRRGRALDDLDRWLESLASLLQRRSDWKAASLFVATDTPRVIPRLQELLQVKTRIKVVSFDQSRPDDGEGVLFGEQNRVVDSGGDRCRQGWVDGVSDMILLSYADVVIAARPSSFTQAMPLSLVFETSSSRSKVTQKEYCEVNRNATEMRCYRSVMDWCCNGSTSFILDGISQTYDYISRCTTNVSHPDMYNGFQPRMPVDENVPLLDQRMCQPRGPGHRQYCLPYDWSVFYPTSRRRRRPTNLEKLPS